MIAPIRLVGLAALLAASSLSAAAPAAATDPLTPLQLEEAARWLLGEDQLAALPASGDAREAAIADLLADPRPATPENELHQAIARRSAAYVAAGWSPLDDRARLSFLRGAPDQREPIDCAETFQPLEIWRYGSRSVILSTPRTRHVMRMWIPLDGKAALYVREMEFWLEQWHSYGNRIRGTRVDRFFCEESERIDELTGVDGLIASGKRKPPESRDLLALLAPPTDLGKWAEAVLAAAPPELPTELAVEIAPLLFPAVDGARIVTRMVLTIPAEAVVESVEDELTKRRTVRFTIGGTIEHGSSVLEGVRARYEVPLGDGPRPPIALVIERSLRPGLSYLARLDVADEVGGARHRIAVPIEVPREATPIAEPDVPADALVALAESLASERVGGADAVLLIPPESDVVFGLWRAEAIVTGERIAKVAFSLDGKVQLTRREPPYTVELALPDIPQPLVVRAEGFDAAGESIASDELVINQPRGELEVTITEPRRGVVPRGRFETAFEVVVPEGRRVERVDIALNDQLVTTLARPPWRAMLEMPEAGELVWVTATVTLDDESRAEDTRFVRVPGAMEQVDVRLVELYTTVTDRSGSMVAGLSQQDFTVREDGRQQTLSKFELVEDLPLAVGITVDVSGSMHSSLGEAQRAAVDFLQRVIGPRDQTFAVAFATKPALIMQRTPDVGAVALALESLAADGWTALHDATIFSLYYFRGIHGRKALVLLSDGDDTSSRTPFRDALEYARRSGVVVYTIGLRNDALNGAARRKLADLAEATGGRAFVIDRAEELSGVYAEIEAELRSQYLLAYAPDRPPSPGFRKVEVEVAGRGITARTIPGYVP